MLFTVRRRWVTVAAVAALLAPSPLSLAAQDARTFLHHRDMDDRGERRGLGRIRPGGFDALEGHPRARWSVLLNGAGLDPHIAGHTHRADWVEPATGSNRFPISVGGGSARGSNTLTRVNVSPDALEVVVTTDDGTEVSRHTVKARR